MAKPPVGAPHLPVPIDLPTVHALKALDRGDPTPHQCKLALDWIIEAASAYYDLSFRTGANGALETAFAEGRRFVGAQIVKQIKLTRKQMEKLSDGRSRPGSRARSKPIGPEPQS